MNKKNYGNFSAVRHFALPERFLHAYSAIGGAGLLTVFATIKSRKPVGSTWQAAFQGNIHSNNLITSVFGVTEAIPEDKIDDPTFVLGVFPDSETLVRLSPRPEDYNDFEVSLKAPCVFQSYYYDDVKLAICGHRESIIGLRGLKILNKNNTADVIHKSKLRFALQIYARV